MARTFLLLIVFAFGAAMGASATLIFKPKIPRVISNFFEMENIFAEDKVGRALIAVRSNLNDPYSAQFEQIKSVPGRQGLGPHVCGMVNYKNGFGGYVGFTRFIFNVNSNFVWLEPEGGKFFGLDWLSTCEGKVDEVNRQIKEEEDLISRKIDAMVRGQN